MLMTKSPLLAALSPLALLLASCGGATAGDSTEAPRTAGTKAAPVSVREIASFNEPWAMAFLPGEQRALITEKSGKLKVWQTRGAVLEVSGVPKVEYSGQGGLGDVVLAPDFVQSGTVYLSFAEAGTGDTRGAAVGRGKLVLDEGAPRIEGFAVIWRQDPKVTDDGHYSHRMAFSPDGQFLFITSGDRQKFTPAQDFGGNLGKIVRLLPDGTPAPGNPFAAKGGVSAQIWTLGHRNLLGLKFDAQGRLWDLEHGPAGGDELNLVKPGKNYGWPVVSDGDHYDGKAIPRHATRPDFATPAISWNPVIAPGDFIFYSGKMFPEWRGQALIAGMAAEGLVRVSIDGEKAREVARQPLGARIREIVEAGDGSIWLLTDGDGGRLLHLTTPAG